MEIKLPTEGPATSEEAKFTNYLLFAIAEFIEHEGSLPRGVLVAALSRLSQIAFCEFDTKHSLDIKTQCHEIDAFCNHLKKHALRNTRSE